MTTKEELEAEWLDVQDNGGCTCHCGHPPCRYCEAGYGVTMSEFVELMFEAPSKTEIYDSVMKDMFK